MKHLLKPDIGMLILRVALGAVLLVHSVYLKLMVFTLYALGTRFGAR